MIADYSKINMFRGAITQVDMYDDLVKTGISVRVIIAINEKMCAPNHRQISWGLKHSVRDRLLGE